MQFRNKKVSVKEFAERNVGIPVKEGPSSSETSCGLSTVSFETRRSRGEKRSLLCTLLSVQEKERKKTLKKCESKQSSTP
jgi:hypothetical protein